MEPLAWIVPFPSFLNPNRAPPPETVRTFATSGIALVEGSSTPVAGCPGADGETETAIRFSFRESADTRAAYDAWRYRVRHPSGIFWSSNADASPMTAP